MLKSFIDDSEKNGTGNIKSHSTLEKGEFLEKIVIQNTLSQRNNLKYLTINTDSNMTIWEFKRIISRKFQISPLYLSLLRSDDNKPKIDDFCNGKMLRDLRI